MEYSHLPKGMYFNKKGQTYYLRRPGQKDIRLGKSLHEALRAYWDVPGTYFDAFSMRDLITRYMNEISPTKRASTHRTNCSAAKFLTLSFGDFKPKDVKAIHIYQHLEARRESKTRANREIALLGSIFTEAVRWGVVEQSPVRDIKRYKETPRTRLVTDQEIAAFKAFAPEWMCLYIDLKVIIALRQGDMLQLNSSMWDERGLWVDTSKYDKKICFEASNGLIKIVRRLQELNNATQADNVAPLRWWFFTTRKGGPYTEGGFRTMWQRVMVKAMASGALQQRFTEHDLRAKAATDCDSLIEAFELCGHSSMSTTKRIYRRGYAHVKPVDNSKKPKLLKKK
jgi:integrase